jgi:hypothetical protein
MANKWMQHLAEERKKKENKGKSLKEVMKIAKKTYKK